LAQLRAALEEAEAPRESRLRVVKELMKGLEGDAYKMHFPVMSPVQAGWWQQNQLPQTQAITAITVDLQVLRRAPGITHGTVEQFLLNGQ
jgi:hypothetical protein